METSASFEARYAPLLYPTNHVRISTDSAHLRYLYSLIGAHLTHPPFNG